jgi:pilus assembly protein CpaF
MLRQIRDCVLERLDQTRELTDEEILACIDEVLVQKGKESYLTLSDKIRYRKQIFDSLRRMDVLQDFLEDPEITEIMVNGYHTIFIEKHGKISKTEVVFDSKERLSDVIQQMVARANRRVNESSPIVDSRLEDGSRVNIVLDPVAINGPIITIRKFPERVVSMRDLIRWGAITEEASEFLKKLVIAGYNIFVCGGTGSGKTTFLNALSQYIPKEERIITIEDSAEMQLSIENIVRLETRNATQEGEHAISIRDLMKSSLRMRPDRIIIGEVRGEEAFDLLQIFNTGHDGSMSTGHGNSIRDMLSRLEIMVLTGVDMPVKAIRGQIAAAVDLMVYLGRLRDKSRKVLEIAEILGMEEDQIVINSLFHFEESGEEKGKIVGTLIGDERRLIHREKLRQAGLRLKQEDETK